MASPEFISDTAGILFILSGNAAIWFFLEKRTGARIFSYFPPLMFIYILSAVFSNTGLIPAQSEMYDWMGRDMLPFLLILLLLGVDVKATLKVAGRGIFVMLVGTLGVVVGAPTGFWLVKDRLDPEAWKAYGTLAGSWIGGTGNMAAVSEGLGTSGTHFGLAVIADNLIYIFWLPLLIQSKNFARVFHRFTGVSDAQVDAMKSAANDMVVEQNKPQLRHYLYLVAIASGATYAATQLSGLLPEIPPVLTMTTYKILLITTLGLLLSFSPAKRIPGSHDLGMAMIYLFVARMGAKAVVSGLAGQAIPFVAGGFVMISVHGIFILLAARIFRIDVHLAAISSAANIGAAATAPVIAAYHDERLVPVSILMSLIGYAVGNYAAFLAAYLCHMVV
jgi:uncharacterized membrane protein